MVVKHGQKEFAHNARKIIISMLRVSAARLNLNAETLIDKQEYAKDVIRDTKSLMENVL